eukprot:833451-Prymnesium_polylepis.1
MTADRATQTGIAHRHAAAHVSHARFCAAEEPRVAALQSTKKYCRRHTHAAASQPATRTSLFPRPHPLGRRLVVGGRWRARPPLDSPWHT